MISAVSPLFGQHEHHGLVSKILSLFKARGTEILILFKDGTVFRGKVRSVDKVFFMICNDIEYRRYPIENIDKVGIINSVSYDTI